LWATIWIAGKLVTGTGRLGTQVATVTTPQVVTASSQRLAVNGQELIVSGYNLPSMCYHGYDDPSWITITGAGGKSFTNDYYLQSCGSRGFVLRLLPDKTWGINGQSLTLTRYGGIDVTPSGVIAVLVDAVNGGIAPGGIKIAAGQRRIPLTGTNLKPSTSFTADDVTAILTIPGSHSGTKRVFRATVVPSSYTSTGMSLTLAPSCSKSPRMAAWRLAQLRGTGSSIEAEAWGLSSLEEPLSYGECEESYMDRDPLATLAPGQIGLNLTIAGVLVKSTPKLVQAPWVEAVTQMSLLDPISSPLVAPVLLGLKSEIHIDPNPSNLAINAPNLHVRGHGLPQSCSSYTHNSLALVGYEVSMTALNAVSGGKVLGTDYELRHCTGQGFTASLLPGKSWGTEGTRLTITSLGMSGSLATTVASLVGTRDPTITVQAGQVANTGNEIRIQGTGLFPSGSVETDIEVLVQVEVGGEPTSSSIQSDRWSDTGGYVSSQGLGLAREGSIYATVTVAGKASTKVAIGRVVTPVVVPTSQALLAVDGASMVIAGSNLPLSCPSQLALEGLTLNEHFTLSDCTRVGFQLSLVPGALWGRPETGLSLTRYGGTLFDPAIRIAWLQPKGSTAPTPKGTAGTATTTATGVTVARNIPDQEAGYGYYEFAMPDGVFASDLPGRLSYSIATADPLYPLPQWLQWDEEARILHGQAVPNSKETLVYRIKLSATSGFNGARASAEFRLAVKSESSFVHGRTKGFFDEESSRFPAKHFATGFTIRSTGGPPPTAHAHATPVPVVPSSQTAQADSGTILLDRVTVGISVYNSATSVWEEVWSRNLQHEESYSFQGLEVRFSPRSVAGLRFTSSPKQSYTFRDWTRVGFKFQAEENCGQAASVALQGTQGAPGSRVGLRGHFETSVTYSLRWTDQATQLTVDCGAPRNSTHLSCSVPAGSTLGTTMGVALQSSNPRCHNTWRELGQQFSILT